MKNTVSGLILSSVTYAMRARDILARHNIKSFCEKLSPQVTGCGCGYGLRVRAQAEVAADILRAASIKIKGYYEPDDIS